MSRVIATHTGRRPEGVKTTVQAWSRTKGNQVRGKNVLLKPNLNTADPTPGSTHNDTLAALIDELWDMGAKSITLGERSWKSTRGVLADKKLEPILAAKDVKLLVFDELSAKDWVHFNPPGSHWPNGFSVARPMVEAECLVQTCCLKTHQFGGVFTLSLKLAVGAAPGREQMAQFMDALHSSPHQRLMIAELNTAFNPAFTLLDGVEAFVDGGPATGARARADVFLAAADRVALDAVGVACLRRLGSNEAIMNTPIFQHDQLKRAAELGLGAASATEVELIPGDEASAGLVKELKEILRT